MSLTLLLLSLLLATVSDTVLRNHGQDLNISRSILSNSGISISNDIIIIIYNPISTIVNTLIIIVIIIIKIIHMVTMNTDVEEKKLEEII